MVEERGPADSHTATAQRCESCGRRFWVEPHRMELLVPRLVLRLMQQVSVICRRSNVAAHEGVLPTACRRVMLRDQADQVLTT